MPLVLALAVALLLLVVILRAPLERAVVTVLLERATGLSIESGDIENVHGGIALDDVRARSETGDLTLFAPRLVLTKTASGLDAELDQLQTIATVGSWIAPLDRASGFTRRLLLGSGSVALRLQKSSLLLKGDDAAWSLDFADINGTMRRVGSATSYDLSGALSDGAVRYPLSARSDVFARHATDHWSADALPLATLGQLVPGTALRINGGQLRDFDLTLERDANGLLVSLAGSARIENGEALLSGERAHALRGLHGSLVVSGDALAATKIAGELDGVPFDASGELDNLISDGVRPARGPRDLAQVVKLLSGVADQSDTTSIHIETTAPGAAFAQYGVRTDHGPLAVQLIAIDPREPTLHWDTALSSDRIVSNGERTSAMGLRTGAVAGVNGDYFDIGRTYQPQGLLISHGVLLRGPTDRMALIVHRDGSVTFSEYRLRGTLLTSRGEYPVTQFNNWPAGDVTVITPAFGKQIPPASGVSFAALIPSGRTGDYRVESVTPMDAPVPVRFGLAFGPLARAELYPGERIHLSFALDPPVADAVAGIGGGPLLLRAGQWYEDPHAPAPDERDVRWPVIALARLSDESLLLVAVDGRHPERSVGMTRPEFADLLRDFKAVDAMALDSGGSVTMVSRAPGDARVSVRNVPSDSSAERWVSDGLFLYSSAPGPSLLTPANGTTAAVDP